MNVIKVFFDNRFIALSQEPDRRQKYSIFHKYHEREALYEVITGFIKDKSLISINVYGEDSEQLLSDFTGYFTVAEAAGGLVVNPSGNYLFIKRFGRWDLPKGHIEEGEKAEACALREIEEECGISGLRIRNPLELTFHTYRLKDKHYLKRTYWFLAEYNGDLLITPNREEGITEGRWLAPASIAEISSNIWESLKDLLDNSLSER